MIKVSLQRLKQIVAPQPPASGGNTRTDTFNPNQSTVSLPQYTKHREDIFNLRLSDDANVLLEDLFSQDPDVSAAFHAYLTVANTEPVFHVYDANYEISQEGQLLIRQLMDTLTQQFDYTKGFLMKPSLRRITENMRVMLLLRGALCAELVVDELGFPFELRHVDFVNLEFEEPEPGKYIPVQKTADGERISLDFPSIFIEYYHQLPTQIYPQPTFASAINTIAARQHVINTLYRIMDYTGFPRIEVEILEEAVLHGVSQEVRDDPVKRKERIESVLGAVSTQVASLRADQAFIHTDSVKPKIMNEKKAVGDLKIEPIIRSLNDQNQAALKAMSTVLGRGDSGVNTSSTEARLFTMNADELNAPIGDLLSKIFTFAIRMQGFDGHCECHFKPAELRPDTELEPMRSIKQSRLHKDLSLGLITDQEYHIQMYNRYPDATVPQLQATGFLEKIKTIGVDDEEISPNGGPVERGLTPDGADAADDSNNQ